MRLSSVAPRLREIWAFGPPASGSAGCGLDRSPDLPQSLRSRGARLLLRLPQETSRAATGAARPAPLGEATRERSRRIGALPGWNLGPPRPRRRRRGGKPDRLV